MYLGEFKESNSRIDVRQTVPLKNNYKKKNPNFETKYKLNNRHKIRMVSKNF